jgi:hypothetical protein
MQRRTFISSVAAGAASVAAQRTSLAQVSE